MEQKDLHKFIENILQKKRNSVPLTAEEQHWVDETYGRLFEKKFGRRTFTNMTKEELDKSKADDEEEEFINQLLHKPLRDISEE